MVISNNKSELLVHAPAQPSFKANDVVSKRNVRVREPSTSASSSGSQPAAVGADDVHVSLAKVLLVQIAKEILPAKEREPPAKKLKTPEARTHTAQEEAKTLKNRARRVRQQEKRLRTNRPSRRRLTRECTVSAL